MQKDQGQQKDSNKPNYVHYFPYRGVVPYFHRYQTFAKERWYGKPLLQTLVKQFKAYDEAYYKEAVESGRITINNQKVSIDYIIKNGDKMIHQAIRQQPPILDLQIQIIQNTDEYLVVNKPPSLTVHTGGGFHFNTLQSILKYQKGFSGLYILHRLDRLTSGLIILGKTKSKPQIFHKQIQTQQMKKMYYARVGGNFKWDQKLLNASIQCLSYKDGIYKVLKQYPNQSQEQIFAKQQMNQQINLMIQNKKELNDEIHLNYKNHENHEDNENHEINKKQKEQNLEQNRNKKKIKNKNLNTNPDIKMSKTFFKKVFYHQQSDSTLLQCYPISGRTHQIRVHLQYLGHSILNDVVYDGRFVGNHIIKTIKNNQNGKRQKSLNAENQNPKYQIKVEKKVKLNQINANQLQNQQSNNQIALINLDKQIEKQQLKSEQSKLQNILIEKLQNEWDYKTKPWQICLHSYQYKLQGKIYTTAKPYWAQKQYYTQ